MRSARFETALALGAMVVPPAGDVVVYRPVKGDDLSDFPQARTVVITGFKPDNDHFAAAGYRVDVQGVLGQGGVALAVVCLPRAKAAGRAMIAAAADAVGTGGAIVVDGQKTDGVESILRDLTALGVAVGPAVSKAHGKLAVITAGPQLVAWAGVPQTIAEGFITLPGVFSADGVDRGSALLADILPAKLPPRVADLGAGWGYLSRAILARDGVKELDVIEAEAVALDCARQNLPDPRVRFHWADATSFRAAKLWDAVVMNPPFHVARAADPNLGLAFLTAAQRGLSPGGKLWLVANRQLPYPAHLRGLFKQVDDLGGDTVYRLLCASYPIRDR